MILIEIYALLAVSLNLISGFTGLLSIGHAAFYGIGAYISALMSLMHVPFVITVGVVLVTSGMIGAVVAMPSLRLRGDYFVIATLAFQALVYNLFNNWVAVTSGPMGLPGIPSPSLFGWVLGSHFDYLLFLFGINIFWLLFLLKLINAPFGRVLKAIREDENLAKVLGKNTFCSKVLVFVIGAIIAAMTGVIYAHYITFIDPSSFTIMESIFILTIVIVGGAGNLWGSIIGATVLVVLPEFLRFIGIPTAIAANMRQIFYGLALVGFMMWRPQGLIGEYRFEKKAES